MKPNPSAACRLAGRILALVIAGYGVYAFRKRNIGDYMLLRSRFVFFDYDEPLNRYKNIGSKPLFVIQYFFPLFFYHLLQMIQLRQNQFIIFMIVQRGHQMGGGIGELI